LSPTLRTVHHPGHRELRARAHRDQQRVVGVAEPLVHRLLEGREVLGDLLRKALGLTSLSRLLQGEVGPARLGRDREAGWHREAQRRHLGEVRTLAAEEVLLVLVAF
jgi:hypothetical protein